MIVFRLSPSCHPNILNIKSKFRRESFYPYCFWSVHDRYQLIQKIKMILVIILGLLLTCVTAKGSSRRPKKCQSLDNDDKGCQTVRRVVTKVAAARRPMVRLERVVVVVNWLWWRNYGLICKRLLAFCPISALIPNLIQIKLKTPKSARFGRSVGLVG